MITFEKWDALNTKRIGREPRVFTMASKYRNTRRHIKFFEAFTK